MSLKVLAANKGRPPSQAVTTTAHDGRSAKKIIKKKKKFSPFYQIYTRRSSAVVNPRISAMHID